MRDRVRTFARRLAVQVGLRRGQARRARAREDDRASKGAAVGITASAICPGYVRTPLVEAQIADQARAHGLPEERVLEDVILAPHAVKRLLEPSEVADVVAFVLGPSGRRSRAPRLVMDLGWTAR